MRAGEVSEVSQDYLKAIWSAQEWGGEPMTATELANRFGTTKANVTEVLKRLDELGLIVRVPYRPPVLTPAGEKVALSMVRRHRLLETFLVESLGYGWDEVHDEAEILEHAASDRLVDRIDAFLGRPQADPHGDPIPDPEGQIESHDSSILLTEAGPGSYEVIRVSDADPAVLAHLAEAGVVPGARIDVFDGEGSGPVRAAVGAEPNDMCWTAAEQTEAGHTEAKQVEVERTVASAVYLTRA
ncbi:MULTISPECIES: metal-dependent transcriptional regulator [Brevibacterium]|uniref:Manganese transport regulator n=3 Tax=Brevibacterium TaxID=1696 RepID=A0A3T0DB25_BREAU|nr:MULTISPECIES: metal-dependent transcriptional regulator [Brevibacterium]AZT92069.1 metal-dependent transcriptional regulator [Brevibacterium aurantiacum]SMX73426.1 iron (metal) dependent repressor, DtxR family [Brevibacterium antiquum CNRZ 918]SMX86079.1 iron (metal) dependent repressor, DtxR family [Brevibacterium antiquum]HCG56817.1 metal-dependent transcriptional regulator [Brevibacterium sp.]